MKNSELQLSDTNDFKFKSFKSSFVDQIDVYHKEKRVAIINGIDGALLRWVSNEVSIKNADKLENMVTKAYKRALKKYQVNN